MAFVLSMLRSLRRSFLLAPLRAWRRRKLIWLAKLYGGQIVLGTNVEFNHNAVFQGRGKLLIQDNVSLGFNLAGGLSSPILLQPRESASIIVLGSDCKVMNGCEIIARDSICVGDRVLIGPQTWIVDSDFHGLSPSERLNPGRTAPVVIEENVWIGAKAIILKGVHVGKNAVVAAGAVVTKDVGPGEIVAGNPARVVGRVDSRAGTRP